MSGYGEGYTAPPLVRRSHVRYPLTQKHKLALKVNTTSGVNLRADLPETDELGGNLDLLLMLDDD